MENTDAMFESDELFVLTGKELDRIATLGDDDERERQKRELVKELATPIRDLDGYGYCEDCGGREYVGRR